MATDISSHWHPAFRPNADLNALVEGEREHEHEHEHDDEHEHEHDNASGDINVLPLQESIAVTQEIEQHIEVAPANPDSPEVQVQVTSDAQGPVSRRTSWAQTATESSAAHAFEDDWSLRDTETFAASMQEEIEYRAEAAKRGEAERNAALDILQGNAARDALQGETGTGTASLEEVQPEAPAVVTAEDGIDAAPELDEQHAEGYDFQGGVSQMDAAVGEAASAPLLLDEEALPTVDRAEPTMQDGDSLFEEFDGASAPGQPLPKAQAAPGHLDRSFTTNFTEASQPNTEQEQSVSRQPGNVVDEGWPSVGDDKTFGELLDDNATAAGGHTHEVAAQQLPQQTLAADDGWGATGEDDAFEQLQAQPQAINHTRSTSEDAGPPAQQQPVTAPDPWGPAVGDDEFSSLQSQPQPAEDAWGAAVDDDAFGDLMTTEESTLAASVQQPEVAANTDALEEKPEEDLAAMWQAALDDDELLDESNDLDPSTFFGDDDDGFLLDDGDEVLTSTPIPEAKPAPAATQPQRSTTNPYIPAQASLQSSPQVNPYAMSSQHLMGQTIGRAGGTPSTGLFDVYGHTQQAQQSTSQRPPAQSAQSFADRSKGGYESPYDLPMDVVKQPRQRPRQSQGAVSGSQPVPTPPPRSTSITSQPAADVTPPSVPGAVPVMPPPSSASVIAPPKSTPKASSGFFEDLPMAAKPRTRPSGAYTPQPQVASMPPSGQMPPTQLPPRGPMAPPAQPPMRPEAPPAPAQQPMYGGFQQPDRLPLLPDQPTAAPHNQMQPAAAPSQSHRYSPSLPTPAQTQNRFSPAPPSQGPPAGASRYSPAPAPLQKKYSAGPATTTHVPPGVSQGHPFAPRTSSPLAFHTDKPHPPLPNELQRNAPSLPSSPPMANGTRTSLSMSPDRTANSGYSAIDQRTPASHLASPPARPKTQSPPTVMKQARYSLPNTERSTSTTALPKVHLSHRRQFSRDLPFVEPTDERIYDPLQRWKGQPIFRWSSSGSIISSLPKQTPFYAAGHGIPSIKCTPGDISIQSATSFMPMDDRNAKFPGPLTSKAKGRKKDVLAWMSGKIEDLERAAEAVRMDFNMDPILKKRVEEKQVLWKLVKIFVDNDGTLEGSKKIEDEVRLVLLPNLAEMAQVMELQSPAGTAGAQADPVDKTVVVQIRQALLEGQRERAVWLAEEKKLWGHAMLLASTMGPEVWKQIIQSFVRSQVKTVGSDARSLAALYQVFAGNAEECVDELVPPSARAGFQMVSKSDGIATGNPLEGLDQWRETLGLVAGNRTPNDTQSTLSLGRLLSGYGRAEAAHSCFLFARHIAKHSGADDAEVNFVVLGSDHKDGNFANDIDAILLTEIYEWALSLSAPSGTQAYIPHLQSFKLIHAQELAAHGLTSKAQAYCDHITSAYTSTTRPSQYYHPTFTQSVADLGAFLSQSPHAAQGLISKKAMNKVSSGAASWFTKFVSGDDGADGEGSHGAAGGGEDRTPFGRVNGDSPNNLSPSASGTDLYNPMMGGGGVMPFTGQMHGVSTPSAFQQPTSFMPGTSAPSKYAPSAGGNKYAPAGGSGNLGVAAEIHPRPASTRSARSYTPAPVASSSITQPLAVPGRPGANRAASAYSADSRRGSAQYGSPQGSYQPSPQGSYQPSPLLAAHDAGQYQPSSASQQQEGEHTSVYGYQPQAPPPSEGGQGAYGYQPDAPAAQQPLEEEEEEQEDPFASPPQPQQFDASDESGTAEDGGYAPPSASAGSYEPPSTATGYEPSSPATGGYAPPSTYSGSYEPPSDDTGGYQPPAASGGGYEPPSYQPYQADDEPAPEEDKPKPKKSFMDDDEDDSAELAARAAAMQKAAADKAADDAFRKAAEADAARDNKKHSNNQSLGGGAGEKKGWFGGWFKKDPNAQAQQGNGPIRAKLGEENSFYYDEDLKKWVNKKGGDDSATPSAATPPPPRASGPPSRAVSGAVGSSAPPSRIVSAAVPGSGPPSRIGTPADGGPAAPPLSAVPGGMTNGGGSGPPSRPSTGMSNASSLDDLLGGPPGGQRKVGGTVKKKKAGRYVDVMAK